MGIDRWPSRLGNFLLSGRGLLWIILAAMVLTASSLAGNLAWDDVLLKEFLSGREGITARAPWDLFAFVHGARDFAEMLDLGVLPWFTHPQLHMAFFRPLASLSHALDFQLFPNHPWLMHVENLGLYAGLIALMAILSKRFLGHSALAMLVVLLYAIDDAHGYPVGWISNRNALLASIFALACLLFHDQWRRRGDKHAAAFAALSLVLGMLSAEFALGILAYLFAYAILLDPAPRHRSLLSLWPYALILVLWGFIYHKMNYGAGGAGYYLDPVAEPKRYFLHLPERMLSLLAAQLAFPSAEFWTGLSTSARLGLTILRAIMIGLFAWSIWPLLRRDKTLQFFALGMTIAVLPVASTLASDRVLLLMGIGGFPLVASVLMNESLQRFGSQKNLLRSLFLGFRRILLLTHLIYAPLVLPLTSLAMHFLHEFVLKTTASVALGADFAQQTLILVTTPSAIQTNYRWAVAPEGLVTARRTRTLATTQSSVQVQREDSHSLVISSPDGLIADPFSILFREDGDRMQVGERIDTPGLIYEVLKVDEAGRVVALRCRFQEELENPGYRWLVWQQDHYVDFVPPPVGGMVASP